MLDYKMSARPILNQVIDSVSSVISQVAQPQEIAIDEAKPILFIHAKDLLPEKLSLLRQYGKVVIWSPIMVNHPFDQLDKFDYLVIDYRLPEARAQIAREDLSKYNVVHYVKWIQKVDDYLSQIEGNVLSSLPKQAVNKKDFDQKLLNEPLVAPSALASLFKRILPCFIGSASGL